MARHRQDGGFPTELVDVVQVRPAFWDPASGRFDPVRLRAAIVSRGWTVGEFAATARVSRACLYNALRAWATSDRTAIRIATTLATREPLAVLSAERLVCSTGGGSTQIGDTSSASRPGNA
jgi:hypothetical protein